MSVFKSIRIVSLKLPMVQVIQLLPATSMLSAFIYNMHCIFIHTRHSVVLSSLRESFRIYSSWKWRDCAYYCFNSYFLDEPQTGVGNLPKDAEPQIKFQTVSPQHQHCTIRFWLSELAHAGVASSKLVSPGTWRPRHCTPRNSPLETITASSSLWPQSEPPSHRHMLYLNFEVERGGRRHQGPNCVLPEETAPYFKKLHTQRSW
jgi:hypothetical protein